MVQVIQDEVRCRTVTHKDGSTETRCSLRRRTTKPRPVPLPPSLQPLPVPELDLPPPLTEDDIPDALPEIPDFVPDVQGADPLGIPRQKQGDLESYTEPRDGDHFDPTPQPNPPQKQKPKPRPITDGNDGIGALERQVVRLLNQERRHRGLAPLTLDPVAAKVARAHSQDMCQRRYFSHESLGGSQPWDRLRRGGARFKEAAENIAVGYSSAQAVHQGWLSSPGHRANRLNPTYRRIGVGLYMCRGTMAYWTELFMR
jgi:uncharacterized protein YkwD